MTQLKVLKSGSSAPLSRRRFLASCSGSAACALCAGICSPAPAAEQTTLSLPSASPVLRVVFSHPPVDRIGWPYVNFPYEPRKKELLGKLQAAFPSFRFLPETVTAREDITRVLNADSEVDGYIVFLLGIPGPGVAIGDSGRPVVFVNELYAGGIGLGAGPRSVSISSSDFNDVIDAVRSFDCLKKLRASIILDGVNRDPARSAKAIEDAFGTQVRVISAQELNTAYESANRSEAAKWAKTWIDKAEKIVEPSHEEIGKSARMYIGMRDLMARNNAQAFAIDCLTFFYSGQMAAYPCLGFCQLNDDGFVGACEADLQSTISMLVLTYLTGRPGYISDPVVDTATKQVIYAHCVAPTKVYGPKGPANPYHIRSHSEDRKGASLRSLLPLNEMTTTLKFVPEQKTMVIHQGRTVANVDEDKACRTKLAVDYPNAAKLFQGWKFGWHRVTVYGDYKERLANFSRLAGFAVVEEG
jgi:hypothetical protein